VTVRKSTSASPAKPADADGSAGLLTWRARPYNTIRDASDLLACSRAHVYALARRKKLNMVTLGGRTMIATDSLAAFIAAAAPWAPSRDVRPAIEARRKAAHGQ
jgi:excisionase family DNA binding protein